MTVEGRALRHGSQYQGRSGAWLRAAVKPCERETSEKWSEGRKPEVSLMETVSDHRSKEQETGLGPRPGTIRTSCGREVASKTDRGEHFRM